MKKISAVYKITNTVTGDFYIGSSKDIKHRWMDHKKPSTWKRCTNSQLYQDMQKYGVDKFDFQIIEEVEIESLKEKEQQFIEELKPTYNDKNAKGVDIERRKESQKESHKEYEKTNKYKEYQKGYHKEYNKSKKGKESNKKAKKKYNNQLCFYIGQKITLCALIQRFRRAGIPHPTAEAKKYLL